MIGGGTVHSIDAIEADSAETAKNNALNYFLLGSSEEERPQAVGFGNTVYMPGTQGAIQVTVLCAFDVNDSYNQKWVESILTTRKWERDLQKKEQEEEEETEEQTQTDETGLSLQDIGAHEQDA